MLDVAKEALEEQPSPIEHVREMQERIDKMDPIICHHMLKAQAKQNKVYKSSYTALGGPAWQPHPVASPNS